MRRFCVARAAAWTYYLFDAVRRRRSECDSSPPQWGGGELRGSEEPQNTHALASPAAEAISDEGRPRRRSVKNRRTFSISRGQSRTRSGFAEARKRLRKRNFDPQKCEASDLAQAQGRPRNRFTAAVFRLPFVRTKSNIVKSASCHRAFRRGLASLTKCCRLGFHSFFVLTNKNVE